MNGTHLTALEGTNPLGFLAALGVQVAFSAELVRPRLWWSDDITPHAVVDGDFTVDRLADKSLEIFGKWKNSPAVNPRRADGSPMAKADTLKLAPADMRTYLGQARDCNLSSPLMSALVAEGSMDRQGSAKPSDLYFTAGNQKFLEMARKILDGVRKDDVLAGLAGSWSYKSKLPSLMWDVGDDRVYALRADDPAKKKKRSNPGPEALAILGLSLHPVFAGRDRTLTQGCSGKWTESQYSWPLWRLPARPYAVKSLLAHAYYHPTATDRRRWFRSWGVSMVLQSPIRRSGQGGYGTFGPPQIVWQVA